jgi:peptidoglycan/LPS O-acetylase OafA/YrhL
MLPPSKDTASSAHLDMLRGLAAVLVAIGHIRLMLIVNTSELHEVKLYMKPFYFITNLGTNSVMVFFVLSGFFIGSSVILAMREDRWQWKKYAIARGARIYTVLVPALILGGIIDIIGSHLLASSIVYSTPNYGGGLPESIPANVTALITLGNLLSLQEIFVPTLGSNHPLWSLANEVWYYAMFPLLVAAFSFAGRASLYKRLIPLFFLSLILLMLTPKIRSLFLIWLMGAAIALVPRMKIRYWQTIAVVAALSGWLVAQSLKIVESNAYVTGMLASALVYCLITQPESSVPALYKRLAAHLSSISYTLYLTHHPFIVFFAALILGHGPKMQPDAAGIATTFAMLFATILYAALLWALFEKQTDKVRRYLETCFKIGKSKRAATV